MRVLFASTQGAGHFGPVIPFIEAPIRQGDEVLVVGPPTLDPRGFPFMPGASPPEEELRPLWGSMPRQPPAQGEVLVDGHIFARLNVGAMLGPIGEAIEEWRPDLSLDAIRPSIDRVLGDTRFRDAARRVTDEMRAQRPIDEFLEVALVH